MTKQWKRISPNRGVDRRAFIASAGLAAAGMGALSASHVRAAAPRSAPRPAGGRALVVIASANGLKTVERAYAMLQGGADPLDAVVEGVRIVEDDPEDMTVGLGGLPNEECVVELDASVMHGPTHRAGAVAALRNIKNPASVAREVARRTDHVLLVGPGALQFALRVGFVEQDLLTDRSRAAWLKWRSQLSREDDWLQEDEWDLPTLAPMGGKRSDALPSPQPSPRGGGSERAARDGAPRDRSRFTGYDEREGVFYLDGVPHTTGTIHCSALTSGGDLAGCTTTSGLSWKLAGRVGDSPIIGAGCYTDNDAGSAGGTGRGEAAMQVCAARTIVMRTSMGDSPTESCLYALQMVADKTRVKRLLNEQGQPNFGLTLYAVRKDGQYGSATMRHGASRDKFAVCDANGPRLEECVALFD